MVESSDRVSPVQSGTFRTGSTLMDGLSASQELPKARVILVGDSGTGKTSLVKQLATGAFEPMCSPTIGIDYHLHVFSPDDLEGLQATGSPLALDIWDSAGQERFRALSSSYFRNISGVLLVFDLNNVRTFKNLESWLKFIHEHTTEDTFVLMLVGNKSDLESKVSRQEIELFCSNKSLRYVETTSTDFTKTRDLFQQMAEAIIKKGLYRGTTDLINKETLKREIATPKSKCC